MGMARCSTSPSAASSLAPAACEASVDTAMVSPMVMAIPKTLTTLAASETGPRKSAPNWPTTAQETQKAPRSSKLMSAIGVANRSNAHASLTFEGRPAAVHMLRCGLDASSTPEGRPAAVHMLRRDVECAALLGAVDAGLDAGDGRYRQLVPGTSPQNTVYNYNCIYGNIIMCPQYIFWGTPKAEAYL